MLKVEDMVPVPTCMVEVSGDGFATRYLRMETPGADPSLYWFEPMMDGVPFDMDSPDPTGENRKNFKFAFVDEAKAAELEKLYSTVAMVKATL